MSEFLLQSIADGSLVLWHDYRRWNGTFDDLSGNGNDGTPSNVERDGLGVRFDDPDGYIQVADSLTVRIATALTLVALCNFTRLERPNATQSQLFSKRDVGGREYAISLNDTPDVLFYDQNNTHSIPAEYRGKKYLSVSAEQGSQPLLYFDGLFETLLPTNTDFSLVSDAPLYIGNWYNASRSINNQMWAVLVFNRALTETEHSVLYGELMNIQRA